MPFRKTTLGQLVRDDPEKARAEVLEAFELARGRVKVAAHYLCVGRRQLYRLFWQLELWPSVDAIRERVVDEYVRENPWRDGDGTLAFHEIGSAHGR